MPKAPYPKDVDSKKLKQLLVGTWASPRHHYVYRANGKWGTEGGAISGNWRIQGNQLIQGDVIVNGPIILLNQDYFIYSKKNSGANGMMCSFIHGSKNENVVGQ